MIEDRMFEPKNIFEYGLTLDIENMFHKINYMWLKIMKYYDSNDSSYKNCNVDQALSIVLTKEFDSTIDKFSKLIFPKFLFKFNIKNKDWDVMKSNITKDNLFTENLIIDENDYSREIFVLTIILINYLKLNGKDISDYIKTMNIDPDFINLLSSYPFRITLLRNIVNNSQITTSQINPKNRKIFYKIFVKYFTENIDEDFISIYFNNLFI